MIDPLCLTDRSASALLAVALDKTSTTGPRTSIDTPAAALADEPVRSTTTASAADAGSNSASR